MTAVPRKPARNGLIASYCQFATHRFTEDERVWLDTYRALDPEQRETILKVAMVMRKPPVRKRGG